MAGAGKSTLLEHLGWWWQATGLVGEVFRFSYEDRAWTANQIVQAIAERLMDRAAQGRMLALSDDAQLEQIAAVLRATRHLLVLDNAESITAAPASIPHALPTSRAGTPGAAVVALARRPLAGGRRLARPGGVAGAARVRGQRLRTRRPRPASRLDAGRADPRPPRRRAPRRSERTRRPAGAAGGPRRLPTAPHRGPAGAGGRAPLDAAGRVAQRRRGRRPGAADPARDRTQPRPPRPGRCSTRSRSWPRSPASSTRPCSRPTPAC